MVSVGLVGCADNPNSAGGYILAALMIIAVVLGIRIVLYTVARCIENRRSNSSTYEDDEIGMHNIGNALAMMHRHQQQLRRSPAMASPSTMQSKMVISAGNDHVSHIARPCPLRDDHT